MLGQVQRGRRESLIAMLAVPGVVLGVGFCLYSLHLLVGWYQSVAGMNLLQQLAAFIQSKFAASFVLTVLWLGRLLALWILARHSNRLVKYRALRRWRKVAACSISALLAAAATFWALLLAFDLHPIAALLPALLLFGAAMYWLESRVAFGTGR